ncbi:MAG: hypothetical protein ACP5NV_00520 [Candidatus Woesearchaeota archaeon]
MTKISALEETITKDQKVIKLDSPINENNQFYKDMYHVPGKHPEVFKIDCGTITLTPYIYIKVTDPLFDGEKQYHGINSGIALDYSHDHEHHPDTSIRIQKKFSTDYSDGGGIATDIVLDDGKYYFKSQIHESGFMIGDFIMAYLRENYPEKEDLLLKSIPYLDKVDNAFFSYRKETSTMLRKTKPAFLSCEWITYSEEVPKFLNALNDARKIMRPEEKSSKKFIKEKYFFSNQEKMHDFYYSKEWLEPKNKNIILLEAPLEIVERYKSEDLVGMCKHRKILINGPL